MSCLFDSISHFFVDATSADIRNAICNYLEANRPIFDDLDTETILNITDPNYIRHMRNPNTWGGGIEISAACNIWNIVIAIHRNGYSPIVFKPLNNTAKHVINIFYTGNHYEALR
jgi:hypothetical protein